MFKDREEAGRWLAQALHRYKDTPGYHPPRHPPSQGSAPSPKTAVSTPTPSTGFPNRPWTESSNNRKWRLPGVFIPREATQPLPNLQGKTMIPAVPPGFHAVA